MINFTVGPVQSNETIRSIGYEQVPYFRTPEFSNIMLENESLMLKFTNAPQNSRVVFITGSGTASMEAVVMNTVTSSDKVIVINGGSFGQRFVNLLRLHHVPFDEIKLDVGQALTREMLDEGELIVSGTNGYLYVPAPWWKTDYFEVRFEDVNDTKKYFYQLDGEGIRYEIVAFVKNILNGRSTSYVNEKESLQICKILGQQSKTYTSQTIIV